MNKNDQIIYCIGDSHAGFFSGLNERIHPYPPETNNLYNFFKSFTLGPALAYNLCEYNTSSKGREKLFELLKIIPKESNLLLCFGEIDCRAHLLKHTIKQNKNIELNINECTSRYGRVILEIANLGFNVAVWGVIPSSLSEKTEYEFPTYGSCFERNQVTKLFNRRIKEICDKNNIKFISIFDELVDQNGLTKMKYYMDPIHLSQKAMPIAIDKFIKKYPEINFKISYKTHIKFVILELIRKSNIYKNKIIFSIKNLIKKTLSHEKIN